MLQFRSRHNAAKIHPVPLASINPFMAHLNLNQSHLERRANGSWHDGLDQLGIKVQAWVGGFLISAMVVMAMITVANMTGRVLHKLILLEVELNLDTTRIQNRTF